MTLYDLFLRALVAGFGLALGVMFAVGAAVALKRLAVDGLLGGIQRRIASYLAERNKL